MALPREAAKKSFDFFDGFTKEKETSKQDFHKEFFVSPLKQKYLTNWKGVKFCYSLPIGQNKIKLCTKKQKYSL